MALLCFKLIRGLIELPPTSSAPSEKPTTFYVAVKVENLKAFSRHLTGTRPTWNQEFFFEISRLDLGVEIELWEKGTAWDKEMLKFFLLL